MDSARKFSAVHETFARNRRKITKGVENDDALRELQIPLEV